MNKKFSYIKEIIYRMPLSVKLVSALTLLLFILPYFGVFSSKAPLEPLLVNQEEIQAQIENTSEEIIETDSESDTEYEEQNFDIH